MKKLIFSCLLLSIVIAGKAQSNKVDLLQDLEKTQPAVQDIKNTATLTSSTRLFGAKDDLTSVIEILAKGSVVEIIGTDSTYYKVVFEETEGYIYKKDAAPDAIPAKSLMAEKPAEPKQENQTAKEQSPQIQPENRFSYLESKYGSNMAARLMAGKIWKKMNSEMVKDSWGSPQKINRVITGNTIKEEWIFKNTWLYFENNTLVDWGPRKD